MDKAIAIGLLVAVVWTALTHGAVEAWSVAIFELLITVLLLLWAIKVVVDRRLTFRMPVVAFPIGALIILGLIQTIARTDETGRRAALSMDVEATRAAVIVLFFIFLSFVIAANFFTARERLRALTNFLVVYGFAMAVFAIIQDFAWDGRYFWLRPTSRQAVFGPFANRNHFAGYLEMLLPLPVALLITRQGRSELRLFYAFAAVMMGVAGFVSLSRGGMISLVAGLMFILLVSARLPRTGIHSEASDRAAGGKRLGLYMSQGVAVLAIAAAITAGILWIGASPVIDRVAETIDGDAGAQMQAASMNRGVIWSDTWALFRTSPVVGVGFGAFQTVYPLHSRSDGAVVVAQSHNDYLQVLADCGIVGGAIALSFVLLVFRATARGVKSRDPFVAGLAAGSGAGIFAMLVHSLFDFNLQLPSHALLFLLLSAAATAACSLSAQMSSHRREHSTHVSAVGSV